MGWPGWEVLDASSHPTTHHCSHPPMATTQHSGSGSMSPIPARPRFMTTAQHSTPLILSSTIIIPHPSIHSVPCIPPLPAPIHPDSGPEHGRTPLQTPEHTAPEEALDAILPWARKQPRRVTVGPTPSTRYVSTMDRRNPVIHYALIPVRVLTHAYRPRTGTFPKTPEQSKHSAHVCAC
jgi:hypothetical protein